MNADTHQPAVQATPTLALKAIYSRTLSSATAVSQTHDKTIDLYAEDAGASKNLDDLLARDDIQAVIIALPIPAQPAYIKRALAAGKHVLAEKPVAKDVATARELIAWYRNGNEVKTGATLAIAEQYRYFERFRYAAERVGEMGRVLGFRLRLNALVQPGSKYYETGWRKTPEYQGGFLLDGGVHFIAAIRLMLGSGGKMSRVSAFTAQLQPHLAPLDTTNATVKLENGSSGTIAISFGTTFTGAEWIVACEKGTVQADRGKVTVIRDGEESVKEFPDEGNGVKQEVQAWAASLAEGKADRLQSPEEALADLEIVSPTCLFLSLIHI